MTRVQHDNDTFFLQLTREEGEHLKSALKGMPQVLYPSEQSAIELLQNLLDEALPKKISHTHLPTLGYRVVCKSCGDFWDWAPGDRQAARAFLKKQGKPCRLGREGKGHVMLRLTKTQPELPSY